MEWPSKNVARGGIFQSAKVNYSPETANFLKTLIAESKMTTMQRNKINYSLRTGEPLPALDKFNSRSSIRRGKYPVLVRPSSSRKRSLNTIVDSGAYKREDRPPLRPKVDREALKQELADRMAFGKSIGPKVKKERAKVDAVGEATRTRYDELKDEIKEREDFLNEMQELGEGPKYKTLIDLQIQERLREMERLKVN